MKRFSALIAVTLFAGLALSSCFPKVEDKYAGVSDAIIIIYNPAAAQNDISMYPIAEAIMLNMLLADSVKTEAESLKDVAYGDSKVIDLLFKSALQEIKGHGRTGNNSIDDIYTITYDPSYTEGVMTVNTGGKLLDELTESDPGWTITMSNEGTKSYTRKFYTDSNIGPIPTLFSKIEYHEGDYTIAYDAPKKWKLEAKNSKIKYIQYEPYANLSDWNCINTLTLDEAKDLSYSSTRGKKHTISGDSEGISTYNGTHMTYELVKPFVYNYFDGTRAIASGEERCTIDQSVADKNPSLLPSNEITMEWRGQGGQPATRYIVYNGKGVYL